MPEEFDPNDGDMSRDWTGEERDEFLRRVREARDSLTFCLEENADPWQPDVLAVAFHEAQCDLDEAQLIGQRVFRRYCERVRS